MLVTGILKIIVFYFTATGILHWDSPMYSIIDSVKAIATSNPKRHSPTGSSNHKPRGTRVSTYPVSHPSTRRLNHLERIAFPVDNVSHSKESLEIPDIADMMILFILVFFGPTNKNTAAQHSSPEPQLIPTKGDPPVESKVGEEVKDTPTAVPSPNQNVKPKLRPSTEVPRCKTPNPSLMSRYHRVRSESIRHLDWLYRR